MPMKKTCDNCGWNDGDDCREPGPPEEKTANPNFGPCDGWKPIARPDSDDDSEVD